MSLVADTATLVHGYTMADVDKMAGGAARLTTTGAMSFDERREIAWFAVIEMLYASGEAPRRQDLFSVAKSAVVKGVSDELRHHGYDRVRGGRAPRFATYWNAHDQQKRPGLRRHHDWSSDFTESVTERLALPAALAVLTAKQYEALAASAAFGSNKAAAAALGICESAFEQRLSNARKNFLEAWFSPETPVRGRIGRGTTAAAEAAGTCKFGHSRAEYGHHDGRQWNCRLCRRNSDRRKRARQTPEQREKRRAANRARVARLRAAETPEERETRLAVGRQRYADLRAKG